MNDCWCLGNFQSFWVPISLTYNNYLVIIIIKLGSKEEEILESQIRDQNCNMGKAYIN